MKLKKLELKRGAVGSLICRFLVQGISRALRDPLKVGYAAAVSNAMRDCIFGAIILVAAAIVAGGITEIVPAAAWESIVEFFRRGLLLLFAASVWGARSLADIRLVLFGTLVLLLLFYILTRPQPEDH